MFFMLWMTWAVISWWGEIKSLLRVLNGICYLPFSLSRGMEIFFFLISSVPTSLFQLRNSVRALPPLIVNLCPILDLEMALSIENANWLIKHCDEKNCWSKIAQNLELQCQDYNLVLWFFLVSKILTSTLTCLLPPMIYLLIHKFIYFKVYYSVHIYWTPASCQALY